MKYKIKNEILKIEQDETPESPREWNNIGKMLCFHNKYNLGDNNLDYKSENYDGWDEIKEAIKKRENALIIYPLYLYDHSGISIKIGDFYNARLPEGHAHFDSGQVGFIYATKEDIKKEYGNTSKATIEKVKECLQYEVETYNDYLTGNTYSFTLYKEKKCKECGNISQENIDSCRGFYGYDFKENGMLEYLPKKWHKKILENDTED